jgi:acetyltransferase
MTTAVQTSKPWAKADPSSDVYRSESHPLDPLFAPRSVAVVGATERPGSVGRSVLWNLLSNPFGGTVFPVNSKRPNVLGIKAYPRVSELPDKVDLVVVTTPADTVPDVLAEAVAAGIRAGIVISAGFKEHGEHGKELEARISQIIRGKMRLIGPNCLGVMNPVRGLNATFAHTIARPGNVALISQSGALLTAILDWSLRENVGFSGFVSTGSMLDVTWGDLIDYFGSDPRTNSIVIYMESIGDASAFLSAAREVSLTKPIIVIKAGRTAQAAKAAASHTGSMTGSDEVLDAAFRRSGVLRVNSISDIFFMSDVLAKQPRPRSNRLAILTNAGGPGVLATDALVAGGGELAELSPQTMQAFDEILPPQWSHNNPVDILGDAEPERYAKSLEIAAKDPGIDGMLVILTPQDMTNPTQIAEKLKPYAKGFGKPVLASWMGGAEVAAGEQILNQAGIPTFQFPDSAVRAFNYMWRYSYNLKGLYETPTLPQNADAELQRDKANRILREARERGRTILTEHESKQLLKAYGIPVVETRIATTQEEAVQAAEEIGYPVVVKLHSYTITHKTDVGGVQLNLRDGDAVSRAFRLIQFFVSEKPGKEHFQGVTVQPMIKLDGYELIVGSSLDSQFGPVMLFGTGGQLVEVFGDRALALPPLNSTLARRMMEQTRIFKALLGVRGRPPVDIAALEELLVRFSQLVVEQRWIKETDINPLLASPDRLLALDARIVLHGPEVTPEQLPESAIRPEDEPLLIRFHQKLSERSVYLRYFQPLKLKQRTAHERLTRICFIDYNREMALVAERKNEAGEPELLAIGRLSKTHGRDEGELAAVAIDDAQRKGLGTELYRRLIEVARGDKLKKLISVILPENREMRALCTRLGFKMHADMEDNMIRAELDL